MMIYDKTDVKFGISMAETPLRFDVVLQFSDFSKNHRLDDEIHMIKLIHIIFEISIAENPPGEA